MSRKRSKNKKEEILRIELDPEKQLPGLQFNMEAIRKHCPNASTKIKPKITPITYKDSQGKEYISDKYKNVENIEDFNRMELLELF